MKLEKIIVLMGPPGSGKGTQSKLLMDKLKYGYFSMGDALREYTKMDTDLGRKIKSIIDVGSAVTDDIVNQIFFDRMKNIPQAQGLVVDGYPRSLGQVEALNQFISQSGVFDVKLLLLDVDKQKLIDRLILRSQTQGRADDAAIASIEKRFSEYETKTATAKNYYESKGEAIHVNGDQPIEAVHQEILSKLE